MYYKCCLGVVQKTATHTWPTKMVCRTGDEDREDHRSQAQAESLLCSHVGRVGISPCGWGELCGFKEYFTFGEK